MRGVHRAENRVDQKMEGGKICNPIYLGRKNWLEKGDILFFNFSVFLEKKVVCPSDPLPWRH